MPIPLIMDLPPVLLQFLGSLIAIAALAGLAWSLKLGRAPKLLDEQAARVAATQVEDGFDTEQIALDREGRAALIRGADDRLMVVKTHGSHFAGRVLDKRSNALVRDDHGRTEDGPVLLEIDSGERRFGRVTLDVDDPRGWAKAVNGIGAGDHA